MKMVVLPFYAAGGILAFVYRSWNKMRFPAIGTIFLGVIDILILIGMCEWEQPADAMPVLVVGAVFSILQCFVLNIVTVCKIYKDCKNRFVPIFFKIAITFMMCLLGGTLITSWIQLTTLIELGGVLVIMAVFMLIFVSFAILSKDERVKLFEIVR